MTTTSNINEFLESSTVHGLAHISSAKSRAARVAWFAIVLACFAIAIHMITSSYKEWQESPVSTTITTHPITELDFPTVTVCPPRGSNTALNHLVGKVKDVNFDEKERQELKDISWETFVEIPNKKRAKDIVELLNTENIRSLIKKKASFPEDEDHKTITLKSSELQGSFRTPGFRDPRFKYKGDFYSRYKTIHYLIDLPENIEDLIGEGTLVVSAQIEGEGSLKLQKNRLQLYKKELSMQDAEDFCVGRGGHLASVGSQEEQDEIREVAEGKVWLGGKMNPTTKEWHWLDGREWEYQNWQNEEANFEAGNECVGLFGWFSSWMEQNCSIKYPFICRSLPERKPGMYTFLFKKHSLENLPLHFWWSPTNFTVDDKVPGLKLSWSIKNGSLPDVRQFVSKELSGEISTPGFGSLTHPNYYNQRHEYSAIIELPKDSVNLVGTLEVELDSTGSSTHPDLGVDFLTGESELVYWFGHRNWSEANAFCSFKGGNLASVPSAYHWQRLKNAVFASNNIYFAFWIGGIDQFAEGKWTWTDGSKWSYEHWSLRSAHPNNALWGS